MVNSRSSLNQIHVSIVGSEKTKLPRTFNLSAYVRMVIKLYVYSQAHLNREYKENTEFRECILSIRRALDKFDQ